MTTPAYNKLAALLLSAAVWVGLARAIGLLVDIRWALGDWDEAGE